MLKGPQRSTMLKGGYRQINKALNICAFEDYIETQQTRLPKIADVEQISPRVLRVLGQNAGKVALAHALSRGPQLTILPVHTPGHKHIHRRYGLTQTHYRHRPGYPGMGRPRLRHSGGHVCSAVRRLVDPLAR
jgi:hypothetical protein